MLIIISSGTTLGGWWSKAVSLKIIIWSGIFCTSNTQLSDQILIGSVAIYTSIAAGLLPENMPSHLVSLTNPRISRLCSRLRMNSLVPENVFWEYSRVPQTLPVKIVIKLGGKIVPHIQLWMSFQTRLVAQCLTGNSKLPATGRRGSSPRRGPSATVESQSPSPRMIPASLSTWLASWDTR